ncbi:universal stress protein [Bdellovibrio bacteriovorus]|uniref:universal stress protein n=1 Tax=Bdellovibrio TaxID=958 RepID=UPI0035A854C1
MATKSILIPDDLAERTTAGRLRSRLIRDIALEFAQKLKMDVELLYVKNLTPGLFKKKQIGALLETYDAIETSILQQFAKAKIKGRVKIMSGSPAEEILHRVNSSENISLIVMGTHGKKGLKKMFLGSVAEEVLRNASLPVLILGPAAQEKRRNFKIDGKFKVLFLTDLADSSAPAEKWALKFCKELDCKVTLLHSVGDQIRRTRQSLYGSGYIPFDMEETFTDMALDAQNSLKKKEHQWAQEGVKVSSETATKEETLEKTFQTKLRQGYHLVVMGTHSDKMMKAFLGSTARKVIQISPLPVLVVRSKS